MFRTPTFHKLNLKVVDFTFEMGISCVKTYPFHVGNENFRCENIPIPYVFHILNDVKFS